MEPVRVFYSWTSDNDHRTCRRLIRDALASACEELSAELEAAGRPVALDHDTKDALGSPAITETIEKKIRGCSAFVADLTPTHVETREDGTSRIIPNPNVMYELGYAYRSIGGDRIITVLNTAFASGARKAARLIVDGSLPFNLRHRSYPECYELPQDAETQVLREERDFLTKQLLKKIRPIVEQASMAMSPGYNPHPSIDGRISTFLKDGEILLNHSGGIQWRDTPHQVYVRFIPEKESKFTTLKLEEVSKSARLVDIPPFSTSSGDFGANKNGYVVCSLWALPDDIVISRDMIQYFKSGEVWGVFGSFLNKDTNNVSHRVEELFFWAAEKIAAFAEAANLSVKGLLVFGITGLEGRRFLSPNDSRPFLEDSFRYEQKIDTGDRGSIRKVAEAASENLWAEAGVVRSKS